MKNIIVKQGDTEVTVGPRQGVAWSESYTCGSGATAIFWDGERWVKRERGWDAVGNGRSWNREFPASEKDIELALMNIITSNRGGLPLKSF